MNPFQGIAEFALGYLKQNQITAWLRFLFELAFSGCVSFLIAFAVGIGTCSGLWLSAKPMTPAWALLIALASGASAAAISMTALFRREQSKLTRGLIVVLPSTEANKEIASD